MKTRIYYLFTILIFSFFFFSCLVPVPNPGDLICVEKTASPGDIITFKIVGGDGKFDIASTGRNGQDYRKDYSFFGFGIGGIAYGFYKSDYWTNKDHFLNDKKGVYWDEFIEGWGTQEVKVRLPKHAVSSGFSAKVFHTEGKGVVTLYSKNSLEISYPTLLTSSVYNVKVGDKVTLTSSERFFDEATFSKEKLNEIFNLDYKLIWIKSGKEFYSLPNECIDRETTSPTSVTFTVPESMKSGIVHVVNEGGFKGPSLPEPHTPLLVEYECYAFHATDKVVTVE